MLMTSLNAFFSILNGDFNEESIGRNHLYKE